MRKSFALFGIGLALALAQPASSWAQTPAGIIELSGGAAAVGIGFTWGHGTLIFRGRRYPLNVNGLTIASVGVNEYTASGSVEGLRRASDVYGTYSAVDAGVTLGGGASISAMRNQNGVVIHLTSTDDGLSLSLAAQGLRISPGN